MDFTPPRLLRSPHLQTLLSSRLVRGADGVGEDLIAGAEVVTLECRDGARLQAMVNPPRTGRAGAPWVLLIHGWLGRADSPYVRRASAALHGAGFGVARLLLRDHGDTAHLNETMFNAARLDEVVDAANALAQRHPVEAPGAASWGLLGFSLGGNFVLRLAANAELSARFESALAVCPVLDPAEAVAELDNGFFAYRQYFLGKWRRSLLAKQAAFPDRYDFSEALALNRVGTLTDYFVARHTEFRDAGEYYSHYTLGPDLLAALRMPTRILATEDDPVVPARHARALQAADAQRVTLSRYGGHCGFIRDFALGSALDAWAVEHFSQALQPDVS